MPDDVATPFEFHVGVTELRESLGFTVQEVARSGNPVVVHRYGKPMVAIVPIAEWRRLRAIESDIEEWKNSLEY